MLRYVAAQKQEDANPDRYVFYALHFAVVLLTLGPDMHSATTTTTGKRKLSALLDAQVEAAGIPLCASSFDANEKGSHVKEGVTKRKLFLSPGQLRRRLKKQLRRPLTYCVIIPTTEGEKRIPLKEFIMQYRPCTLIVDPRGGIHIGYWAEGLFDETALGTLALAVETLRSALFPIENRRNSDPHFGLMRTMSPTPFLLRGSEDTAVSDFIASILAPILNPVRTYLPLFNSYSLIINRLPQ